MKENALGRPWEAKLKAAQHLAEHVKGTESPSIDLYRLDCLNFVFDLAFEAVMKDGEVRSLVTQIDACYHRNIQRQIPFQMHICNNQGLARHQFDKLGGLL